MEKDKKKDKKERKPNWKEYTATVEDIQNFLMDRLLLRNNVVSGRVEYKLPTPDPFQEKGSFDSPSLGEGMGWAALTDVMVNTLWTELSAQKKVRAEDIWRVIRSKFVPDFNPFTFYLSQLPPWDGDDYILGMSVSVTVRGEVEEQMRFAEYLKKWLVAMVAGWVDASVVNNVILVLIGEQGAYKTTWFNYLLPPELRPYFRIKTNSSTMTKDDLLSLSQYGLVCCEELDTMTQRDLNQLKSAVTMTSVNERIPYERFPENRPHIASFCGTGNNSQFLNDATGNRRWLPFEVASIESPRDHPFDYTNIYAQAYALYRQGFRYWFTREEIMQLSEHNRQFEVPRMEVELVQQFFRRPVGQEPGEFMPVSLALQIVGAGITQKLSSVMLGRAFRDLGFEQVRTNSVRGYRVVRRSAEEMRSLRMAMGTASPDPSKKMGDGDRVTDVTDIF